MSQKSKNQPETAENAERAEHAAEAETPAPAENEAARDDANGNEWEPHLRPALHDTEIRAKALAAAVEVRTTARSPEMLVRDAKLFEHYIRTGEAEKTR